MTSTLGFEFRVSGSGFRVSGQRKLLHRWIIIVVVEKISDIGIRISGFGYRATWGAEKVTPTEGFGHRVSDLQDPGCGSRVPGITPGQNSGFQVLGLKGENASWGADKVTPTSHFGFRVSGSGFRVPGFGYPVNENYYTAGW